MASKNLIGEMEVKPGERSFTARITTNAVDRDKEVLLPEGMDATDFEKSPTIFWAHDYFQPPLGKCTALKRFPGHWTAKAVMAKRPNTHPASAEWFPDTVLSLMSEGVIRGVSVGFDPVASRKPTPDDKKKFGDGVANIVSRWRLLEYSIAPMPANQDALVEAVGKGIVKHETVKAVWGIDAKPVGKKTWIIITALPTPKKKPKIRQCDINKSVAASIARRQGKIYM